MTKKPFKVFSTTALAAAFAVSAIAPVAAAELPAENTLAISDVIVQLDGKNVAIPLLDYLDLLASDKIAGDQAGFVKSNGKIYSMADYIDASAAVGGNPTPDQILEYLSAADDVEQDIEVVEVDYDENGNPIPSVPTNPKEEALTAATDAVEALPKVADITVADKAAVAAAAILVADAKELGADVDALEVTITALEEKIAELEEVVEELTVESVMAINAKELQVTFDGAADTTKAQFDVKRGTTSVTGLEVSWSEDKKVATLTSDVNLAAGDYTVTVTGLSEEALNGTVKVAAQKVDKVEVISQQLIKNNVKPLATAGTFTYKVMDQYGTDITKTTPQSAFNLNAVVGASTAGVTLDPSKGVATVSHTFATTDNKAVVTLVHKATGVATTATLDVAAAVTVENVTFGTNMLPEGKTRIEAGLSESVRVPLTVTDQYGKEIKDVATLSSSLSLISSNPNVSFSYDTDEDGKVFLVMDTSALSTKTPVVLTAVNPTSGKTFSKTFDVVAASAPYAIELGELSQATVAAGDNKIALPITVTDQFGEKLAAEQIVKNAATIENWVTGDNNSQITNLTVDTDKTSKTYGQLVFNASAKGTVSLVVNTGNDVQTKLFEVKDKRVVTTVSKTDNITLLQGASQDLKFVFKDQYGDVVKNTDMVAGNDNADLSYEIEITKVSGDNAGLVLTSPSPAVGDDEKDLKSVNVKAATDKTGSYKVAVSLLNSDNVAVSSASTTVSVKENNVAGLEYTLSDVSVLNGSADNTGTLTAANNYAEELELTAKDANGQTYVINPADIVTVSSSDDSIAKAAKAADGKIYVAGNDVKAISTPAKAEKATITVTINTLDGLKTVEKEVTVSPAAVEVSELKVVTAALSGATKDVTGVTEQATFENLDKDEAANTGTPIYVIGKDQYGVWTNVTAVSVIVNSTNLAQNGSIGITGTDLKVLTENQVTSGKDIKLTLVKDGATKQITYKLTDADKVTGEQAGTADATFTATTNFTHTLVAADIDMDPNTPGVQNSIDLNGVTYTVADSAGTATVTASGTATAATTASTKSPIVINVKDGKINASDTMTLNLAAVTQGGTPAITVTTVTP